MSEAKPKAAYDAECSFIQDLGADSSGYPNIMLYLKTCAEATLKVGVCSRENKADHVHVWWWTAAPCYVAWSSYPMYCSVGEGGGGVDAVFCNLLVLKSQCRLSLCLHLQNQTGAHVCISGLDPV